MSASSHPLKRSDGCLERVAQTVRTLHSGEFRGLWAAWASRGPPPATAPRRGCSAGRCAGECGGVAAGTTWWTGAQLGSTPGISSGCWRRRSCAASASAPLSDSRAGCPWERKHKHAGTKARHRVHPLAAAFEGTKKYWTWGVNSPGNRERERERIYFLPQWQKTCSVQNRSKGPLHLLVVDQQCGLEVFVIGWEREARVQHLVHPGRFKALVSANANIGPTVKQTGVKRREEFCKYSTTYLSRCRSACDAYKPESKRSLRVFHWVEQ